MNDTMEKCILIAKECQKEIEIGEVATGFIKILDQF